MFHKYRILKYSHIRGLTFLVKLSPEQIENVIQWHGGYHLDYIGETHSAGVT